MNTQWMFYSPIFITVICLLFYLVFRLFKPSLAIKNFVGALLMGGILGVGVSVIVVIVQTILYQSPQGPLMLIYYFPTGFATGEVFGVLLWLYRESKSRNGDRPRF